MESQGFLLGQHGSLFIVSTGTLPPPIEKGWVLAETGKVNYTGVWLDDGTWVDEYVWYD